MGGVSIPPPLHLVSFFVCNYNDGIVNTWTNLLDENLHSKSPNIMNYVESMLSPCMLGFHIDIVQWYMQCYMRTICDSLVIGVQIKVRAP